MRPERREILDAQALADQRVIDVEHHDLADEQGVGAERHRLEQPAFEAGPGLGEARRGDLDGRRGIEAGGGDFALFGWKIDR